MRGWINSTLNPSDVREFAGSDTPYWPAQQDVRLNTLRWPTGASRWAVAHLLASGEQALAVRQYAFSGSAGQQSVAQTLRMGDGTRQISASMYLLPPRPLMQRQQGKSYLLTLVDERYFWWVKRGTITNTASSGLTWAGLYAALGAILGVTIHADAVSSAYLKPPVLSVTSANPLPPLLDLAATACGQRVVRKLDGTVVAQTPASAAAQQGVNLVQGYQRMAGGYLLV